MIKKVVYYNNLFILLFSVCFMSRSYNNLERLSLLLVGAGENLHDWERIREPDYGAARQSGPREERVSKFLKKYVGNPVCFIGENLLNLLTLSFNLS